MATKAKVLEYHCPHCNKKLSSFPKNDCCYIGRQCYGAPMETCRKCKKMYFRSDVTEAAQNLTLSQKVPFWLTAPWALIMFGVLIAFIAAVIGLVLESSMLLGLLVGLLFGAAVVFIPYLLLCALTRRYRQNHKDRVLAASRERMKDPEYFAKYLVHTVGADGLTSGKIILCYTLALSDMQKDQPLDVLRFANAIHAVQP